MAQKAEKFLERRLTCDFCGDSEDEDGRVILWGHPLRGPFICEQCVWKAASIIQQEDERLRPDVYVKTSGIHGRGCFAGQRIAKGTYVGNYSGLDNCEYTRHNEHYVIFTFDDETGEETGWRLGTNEFRFLNHSDDPNLEMDENYDFYARRSIKKHEELTWYYGEEFSAKRSTKR